MLKELIILVLISQIFSLSCNSNEFAEEYNTIFAESEVEIEVCHECPAHCLQCTEKDVCNLCENGYYNKANICMENLTMNNGCLILDLDGNCSSCGEEYWLNKSQCVKKGDVFIEKCENWSTEKEQETCIKAKAGYGLNSGTEFIKCVDNCDECSNTKCTKCAANYHLSDDELTCIENEGICLTWKDITKQECASCPTGYTGIDNYCYNSQCENKCESGKGPGFPYCTIECPNNCSSCSSETSCTECIAGHYLNTFSCEQLCKENCEVCESDSDCQQCKISYYKNQGNCVSCLENCVECENSDECIQCDSGYMLNAEGKCIISQILYCKKSDDGTNCDSCHKGFYLNNNACFSCIIENCGSCSDAVTCIECSAGYILYNDGVHNGRCISCTEYGIYQNNCGEDKWIKFPWICRDLESNCIESEQTELIGVDEQQCKSCEEGYRVKDKECVKCLVEQCKDCGDDESECVSCKDGYFKQEGESIKCISCLDNCDQCNNQSVCLDCATGYAYNNELSVCEKCDKSIENCKKCWSSEECLECNKGYYLQNNACEECSVNCSSCYDEENCSECSEGFYFSSGFQCKECIGDCSVCENNWECIQCRDNFYLSEDRQLCMYKDECKEENINCKVCNIKDTTKCSECEEEYYLEITLCKKCLDNCLKCENENQCEECNEKYELNSDKTECIEITNDETTCFEKIEGCVMCQKVQTGKCRYCEQGSVPTENGLCKCEEGLYLIDGVCQEQEEQIDFDNIGKAEIEDLLGYINEATSGDSKGNNTEKTLKQLQAKLKTINSASGAQAASLLIALSETTTTENGQEYYKEILKDLCDTKGLDDNVYFSLLGASDKFYLIVNGTQRQTIYNYGFTNCVKNYLKKSSPEDVSVIKFDNSEFQIKELAMVKDENLNNQQQELKFIDTQVLATVELKNYLLGKSELKQYYMVAQAINHDANPFYFRQINSIMYESKIMSVMVMSKESSTDNNIPSFVDIELNDKSFNVTFDFEGTKCGYYDEEKFKWLYDGNTTGQTCQFNHTTHFVIYQETATEAKNAYLVGAISIFWIVVLVIFQ